MAASNIPPLTHLVGGAHRLQVLLEVLNVRLQPNLEDGVLLRILHSLRLQRLLVLLRARLPQPTNSRSRGQGIQLQRSSAAFDA